MQEGLAGVMLGYPVAVSIADLVIDPDKRPSSRPGD
jgi:hypothetical protein